MSQEHVEAIRSAFDGWNRGDIDAWMKPCHPEAEWASAVKRDVEGPEAVYRGEAGLRQFWEEWHALWDMEIELQDVRDLGDTVVALGHIQIRGGASGIDLDFDGAYVFEFEGGLVRRARAYLDHEEALASVGLEDG